MNAPARVEFGNGWTVYLGDCLDVLPFVEPVDHAITDPPYEREAHTKQRRVRSRVDGRAWRKGRGQKGGTELVPVSFEAIDPHTRGLVVAHFARIVKRWVLIFCQAEGAPIWRAKGRKYGLRHVRECVWIKPDGQPQLTGDRPGTGYEAMELMAGDEVDWSVIETMHTKERMRWNGGGRRGVYVHNTRWRPELSGEQAYRRGGREGQDDHETTKPLSLLVELVELHTDPGERVLDPFMGSGTTGVACLRLGRRFVGVERDPASFALAVERLRAEEGGSSLAARRAGQTTLFASKERDTTE